MSKLKFWGRIFLAMGCEEKFNYLDPKERKILEMRFGLKDGITNTLGDVAKEFGVTRERIRQIEAKAIEKLKYNIGQGNLG